MLWQVRGFRDQDNNICRSFLFNGRRLAGYRSASGASVFIPISAEMLVTHALIEVTHFARGLFDCCSFSGNEDKRDLLVVATRVPCTRPI